MRISTPGARHAHGVRAHLAIGLLGDEDRGLGLAVELLEVDPERAVEIEDLRPDRLARGIAHAHPAQPHRVLQRAIDQQVAQPVFEPVPAAHGLAVQQMRADLAGMRHEDVEEPLLHPAGIFHPDHHVGELRLEHARRRKVIGRPDLAQVGLHRVGAFGAVHAEARPPIGLADREDEIAHPGHRQVGEDLVSSAQLVELAGNATSR
jgi:hypothetical protein